jgi:hypothetical protein
VFGEKRVIGVIDEGELTLGEWDLLHRSEPPCSWESSSLAAYWLVPARRSAGWDMAEWANTCIVARVSAERKGSFRRKGQFR